MNNGCMTKKDGFSFALALKIETNGPAQAERRPEGNRTNERRCILTPVLFVAFSCSTLTPANLSAKTNLVNGVLCSLCLGDDFQLHPGFNQVHHRKTEVITNQFS